MEQINQSHPHSRGFSLVEVMISMVVIIAIVTTTHGMINIIGRAVGEASAVSTMANSAQHQIDCLRNKPYTEIIVGTSDFSSLLPSDLPKPSIGTMVVTETRPGLKRVRIEISSGSLTQVYVTLVRGNSGT